MSLLPFSTNVSCTWRYKDETSDIDYDKIWESAKNCIIKSWDGDVIEGVLSSSMPFTLQTAEKNILKSIPEISSVEMLMPNLLYADFEFAQFQSAEAVSGGRRILLPVEESPEVFVGVMSRKNPQNGNH